MANQITAPLINEIITKQRFHEDTTTNQAKDIHTLQQLIHQTEQDLQTSHHLANKQIKTQQTQIKQLETRIQQLENKDR